MQLFLLSLICTTSLNHRQWFFLLVNESAATIVSSLTQLLSNVQAISARWLRAEQVTSLHLLKCILSFYRICNWYVLRH